MLEYNLTGQKCARPLTRTGEPMSDEAMINTDTMIYRIADYLVLPVVAVASFVVLFAIYKIVSSF